MSVTSQSYLCKLSWNSKSRFIIVHRHWNVLILGMRKPALHESDEDLQRENIAKAASTSTSSNSATRNAQTIEIRRSNTRNLRLQDSHPPRPSAQTRSTTPDVQNPQQSKNPQQSADLEASQTQNKSRRTLMKETHNKSRRTLLKETHNKDGARRRERWATKQKCRSWNPARRKVTTDRTCPKPDRTRPNPNLFQSGPDRRQTYSEPACLQTWSTWVLFINRVNYDVNPVREVINP